MSEELRAKRYNATVAHLEKLHSDLMVLRVKPDNGVPAHRAGQFATLGLGLWEPRHEGCQPEDLKPGDELKLMRRAYSISSSMCDDEGNLLAVAQDGWLEFYIVLVREGGVAGRAPVLTPRLFRLKTGDRLEIGPKIAGHYTLAPVQPGDTVLFLSTGTGEAPHNYMAWELLKNGHTGAIVSACCVRLAKDLGYRAKQESLMKRYPQYKYVGLTTREPGQPKRYLQDMLESGDLERQTGVAFDAAKTHVFICGNPKMIGVPERNRETGVRSYPAEKGVVEVLEKRGFRADDAAAKVKGNIHFEEYW